MRARAVSESRRISINIRGSTDFIRAIADIQRGTEGSMVPTRTDVIMRAVFELRDRVSPKKTASKR